MQIRNPADASAVEESFKRFFEVDAADMPREARRLFVEVLDFADARGQVSLIGAPATVTLPQSAERVAQLDGVHVLYIDLNTVDNDRVRKAEVEAAARRIADQLGEDMLLVVVNKSGTQLHIIHPDFNGARIVLRRMVIGRDVPRRTVVQQISNIYSDYEKSKNLRKVLRDAFDVEPVTRDFFRKYKEIFGDALETITGFGGDDDDSDKRLFTQTLFNRLMFVHFLSRKGWLSINGDKDYLQALWNDYQGDEVKSPPTGNAPNFYRDRLRLLFFTGLNNPDSRDLARGASPHIGKVPFLNGGLFTEGDYDGVDSPIVVPDSVIEGALAELFEKFNFTVMESTPFDIEVAVDPEMLGKVFEELVNERHDSGAYYTPRPVVAFMCREALKGYLEGKETGVSADAIAAFVDTHDASHIGSTAAPRVGAELDTITVVDPACGSGAFLLGMMQELVELRTALFRIESKPEDFHALKLHIIERNLYGVDIDEFAVNIAMLRLWLSLAIDFDGDTPPALPNLDFKIVCGDSLLGPDPSPDNYGTLFRDRVVRVADQFAELKGAYMNESDRFRKAERQEEIGALERELTAALAESPAPEDAVDWRVQFAEVFALRGGFDVAIANPPYVRYQKVGEVRFRLRTVYTNELAGNSDLYCYFYARALQLIRANGIHVFVCSNSWLDVAYGLQLQEYLSNRSHLQAIYESAVERQFTTAQINTLISVLRRIDGSDRHETLFVSLQAPFDIAIADTNHQRRLSLPKGELSQLSPPDSKSFQGYKWGAKQLRAPNICLHIIETKKDSLARVGDFATVKLGITTGANDFFYVDEQRIRQFEIEERYLKPILRTPRESRAILIRPENLAFKVFVCHDDRDQLQGTRALAYIRWGESQGYSERPLCSSRTPWYDLGTGEQGPLAMHELIDSTAHTYWAAEGIKFDKNFDVLDLQTADPAKACASLNSSLFQLMLHSFGRENFGGGLLRVATHELAFLQCVAPALLPEVGLADLEGQDWNVLNPSPARRKIDDAVFDALSLTQGERDAVYEGVTELVENRLRRARSTRGRG